MITRGYTHAVVQYLNIAYSDALVAMRRADLKFVIFAIVPILVLVWSWIVYPLAYAVFNSFHAFDILKPWEIGKFVGFKSYLEVFNSYYFIKSLYSTVIFMVMTVPWVVSLSLAIALLLNEEIRGISAIQVLVLTPWAIPYVVAGTMFKWIYDANYGLLNYIALKLEIIPEYQAWLTQPWPTMFLLALAYVWTQYPLPTILLLARLKLMPSDIYEAAVIDGASAFKRFRYITLTWLRPVLRLVVIYQTIMALVAFDLIYVITGGGPFDFTSTISFFTYREAFQFFDWSKAFSLCTILLIMGLILVYIYLKALPEVRYR